MCRVIGWFIGFSPDYTVGCWVGADDPAIHFRNLQYGQGSFMALPVVGKFFSQMYADSRFKGLLSHHFESPDSITLIQMNELPDNVTSIYDDFNFFDFFKKKIRKTDTGEERNKQEKKPSGQKKEEPVWEKIKRIFKKK
jgi:penicillin-binding protein 1A